MYWIVIPKEDEWNTISFILFYFYKIQFRNINCLTLVYSVIVNTVSYIVLVRINFQYLVSISFW